MSGHIGKSTFNNNNNNKAVFIYSNKTMQKDFPEYATHGPLNDSYFADEASHTRLIQSPNNQRKEKSRLSCCVAGSASVFPSLSTEVRSAREARGLSTTNSAHEAKKTASLFHKGCSSSDHSSPLSVQLPITPLHSLFSVHTRFLSSEAPPPWPASFSGPTPLLGVPPLSPPIGRADTPSARQRDRWAFPPLCLADSLPDLS